MKTEKNYTLVQYDIKDEWLGKRGIGGSSASSILDANPWKTKLELYQEFTQINQKRKDTSNASTEYGNALEPIIREVFRIDFKDKYEVIDPNGFELYRRTDKPYLTATIDGTLIDKETNEKGILEIKTHDVRGSGDYANWLNSLPQNYYIQILHYLMVLNDYTFAILCAKLRFFENGSISKQEIRYYRIDRKEREKEIEYLEREETYFYEENVSKRIIPQVKIKF